METPAVVRPPGSLRRILVAEDDPDTQVIVSFVLRRGGFAVEVCGSGAEALSKAHAFDPQLVLLDVMLPFMDGPSILREMRGDPALAAIPVVFITARALPAEIAAYRALGPLEVIVKPFDPMTLAETLDAAWAGRPRGTRPGGGADLGWIEDAYVSRLHGRVEEIDRAARRFGRSRASAALVQLCQLAHRLSGSSAILGFPYVSDAARAVETIALELHRRRRRPSERERKTLESALRELRRVATAASVPSAAPGSWPSAV